jgi:hypothetical protein
MCLPGVRPPTALGTTGANATSSQQRLHSGNLATGTAALPRPSSLTAQGQRQQKKPSRSRIGAGRSGNDTTSDAAPSSGLPSALQARISQTISPTLHKMDKVRRRPAVAWKPGPEGPPLGLPLSLETATLTQLQGIDPRGACWYERALELARQQDFEKSRRVFQAIVMTYPNLCRAWVSWAQVCAMLGCAPFFAVPVRTPVVSHIYFRLAYNPTLLSAVLLCLLADF